MSNDLEFQQGSTFQPTITYWQDEAKTTPHDLTGFTANFLVKDDKSDDDADALHNLTNGSGLTLTPLTAVIEPVLTDEQTQLLEKSVYWWQQKITSSGGETTIIAEGRLVKT